MVFMVVALVIVLVMAGINSMLSLVKNLLDERGHHTSVAENLQQYLEVDLGG